MKILKIYLAIYLFFASCLFLFLRDRARFGIESGYLKQKALTVSTKRDFTDDPCLYSLRGEPNGFGEEYVKINLYCDKSHESVSTFAIPALPEKTYLGLIRELARIANFSVDLNQGALNLGKYKNENSYKWSCFHSEGKLQKIKLQQQEFLGHPVEDLTLPIINKSTLKCYYHD